MMMRNVLSASCSPPTAINATPSSSSPPPPSPLSLAASPPSSASSQTKNKRRSPSSPTATARKKLRSLAVEKLNDPVPVAPLKQRVFVSWAAFDAHMDVYCARTFQVLRANTCVPVAARNARVSEQLAARGVPLQAQTFRLIPSDFEMYSRTLVCTHAGVPRRRHEGKRPNRNVRALGCPAKLNLVVKCAGGTALGLWRVHVTDQVAVHNHVVSAAQFKLYPQQRRVTDPDVLHTVRAMRKYGTPRRGIFEYIRDTTANDAITMRDVTNLLNKMKAEDEKETAMGATDAQQEEEELDDEESETIRHAVD